MRAKGIGYTILSALLFGVTPVLATLSYQLGSNAVTLTFYRNLMVTPILFMILLIRKTELRVTKKQFLEILAVGILGRGVTTLMLYSAYSYIGISTSTTLHFLYPVFVALICRIFYREKLGMIRLIALACAVVGVLLFMEHGESLTLSGTFLAAGSGLTYAIYMVGVDKLGLKEIDPFKLSFYMAAAVAAGMLLYDFPGGKIVFILPMKVFLYTFILAVSTSFFAVALLQIGIKYLSATTAALFSLFEPICGSLTGTFFLNEPMTMSKVAGSGIILSAAVILAIAGKNSGRRRTAD
ncbi:DMT family transporter [Marasmitruncus massiliensis]|uniref:DMT family transporter n=1 Tax=Marasmitruncus massiliensis TaxID=1944642 RepID=UPI0015E0C58A|nr:DMT family transporter [Marasmitruncus massiliensis]